jgi:hypothetical protein
MSFWDSELGELSGKSEDAFTRVFSIIPNNTTAIAKIASFKIKEGQYSVEWEITQGEFKGQHVFQKIKAFDTDVNKRHRALNMLKYLYGLYKIQPKHNEAPTDEDLKIFIGKTGGIKIQEWSAPKKDGHGYIEGNFVSEVHPVDNFKCETGVKMEVVHNNLESAFSRNQSAPGLLDDLPF